MGNSIVAGVGQALAARADAVLIAVPIAARSIPVRPWIVPSRPGFEPRLPRLARFETPLTIAFEPLCDRSIALAQVPRAVIEPALTGAAIVERAITGAAPVIRACATVVSILLTIEPALRRAVAEGVVRDAIN
ncbi:MAG: hypothetical protein ACFCUN_02975 [Hyphomicrobiaceae bacterium]